MASLTDFDAIQEKEYFIRFYAARNNEKYKVSRSRLIKGQSPIQKAVQDSYITMEELQDNKTKELQDQHQPNNSTSDWYSHHPKVSNNDDSAKQVAEEESKKKQK